MIQFPHNFFWGAATSAYQVEGNNFNSDWSEWEKRVAVKEPCGEACRHYELYRCDFDLAGLLNHNCHRLSIEWSRIEPEEGRFSEKEIGHYRDVILALKERNLEPVVTLHHFTNPVWFAKSGGWENKKATFYFTRYVRRITEELSDKVSFWVTINEPMIYVYHGYISGLWPPQKKSFLKSRDVEINLAAGHIQAYRLMHAIYREKNLPAPRISIAHNMQAFVPCSPALKNRLAVYLRNRLYNFEILDRLARGRSLDFIGLNYYTRSLAEARGWFISNLLLDNCRSNHHPLKKNDMGWDIYPEGLYQLLIALKKRYSLPVFILENGICIKDDSARWNFIYEHLKSVSRALDKGVDVLGYIYWSLLDNYEWDRGFGPRFGIVGVDYNTYKRTIRESAKRFALVCKTGILEQWNS